LFGWGQSKVDAPHLPGGVYPMMTAPGTDDMSKAHCGVFDLASGKSDEANCKSFWIPYVCVTDTAAIAERVKQAGGSLHVGVKDVGNGILAICNDPQGAQFALWQSKSKSPSETDKKSEKDKSDKNNEGEKCDAEKIAKPVGSWCWEQLLTINKEGAFKFYCNVFDNWVRDSEGGFDFLRLKEEPRAFAAIMQAPAASVKDKWMSYVSVENVDASAKQVVSLGGQITLSPLDIPGVGRKAVCVDDSGAAFTIFTALPALPTSTTESKCEASCTAANGCSACKSESKSLSSSSSSSTCVVSTTSSTCEPSCIDGCRVCKPEQAQKLNGQHQTDNDLDVDDNTNNKNTKRQRTS